MTEDGFYQEEERPTAEGPTAKQRVLKKIPSSVRRHVLFRRAHNRGVRDPNHNNSQASSPGEPNREWLDNI